MNTLAFVARQVFQRQINMTRRDCKPLLGVALALQSKADLARRAVAVLYGKGLALVRISRQPDADDGDPEPFPLRFGHHDHPAAAERY